MDGVRVVMLYNIFFKGQTGWELRGHIILYTHTNFNITSRYKDICRWKYIEYCAFILLIFNGILTQETREFWNLSLDISFL